MSVPAALSRVFRSPCAGRQASITAHTVVTTVNPVCMGTGWSTRSTITITGALGSFQLERQWAIDAAGTSWQAWVTSQNLSETITKATGLFGSGGAGADTTKYFKARARIVAADDTPCTNWTESSSQLTKTEPACTA